MPLKQHVMHAWNRWTSWVHRELLVADVHGDEVPSQLPRRRLLHMIDEGQPWAVVLSCPCGCGEPIELSLSRASKTHWTLTVERERPTLRPSVWRNTGCRAHFWVERGRIRWVA